MLEPDLASHTFAIPELGVSVPLKGVADDAKNQCERRAVHARSMAHTTITFTFRTGQTAALPLAVLRALRRRLHLGFGGPMQSIGYMDGLINVV